MNAVALGRTRPFYWIVTLLFAVPILISGAAFLAAVPKAVEGLVHLGYPVYLVRFLGVAKLLAVLAIVTGRLPRVKEWAYAGLTFDLLGAVYSHLASGDRFEALPALVVLAVMAVSYALWKRDATETP